jgi:L-lactate dehydrogenase complex protein LldF
VTWLGVPAFPKAAHEALADSQLRSNLRHATHTIRDKRARTVAEVPDWEQLRRAGEAIKNDVLANLDTYLQRLEAAVTARGGVVHWARDAAEANELVLQLAREADTTEVVKVKSMATAEIGLNEALAAGGVTAVETDLAELIVQLGHDRPLFPRSTATGRRSVTSSVARCPARRPIYPPNRRHWRRRRADICGKSSSPPGSRSRARTSRSPTPVRSWWWNRRATGVCA